MLNKDSLVVDDVQVVHPDLERQVHVFTAGDLVFLAPCAEVSDGVGAGEVDDRGGRGREGRQHLDLGPGFGANGVRIAGGADRWDDNPGLWVGSRRLQEAAGPARGHHGVVVAKGNVGALGHGQALVHALGKPQVRLVGDAHVAGFVGVVGRFPSRAVVDHDQLVGHVGVSADRFHELLGVQESIPLQRDDRQDRVRWGFGEGGDGSEVHPCAHAVEYFLEGRGATLPIEVGVDQVEPRLAQPGREVGVASETRNGIGHCCRVPRWDHQSGLAIDGVLETPTIVGGHQWSTAGQSLEARLAESLEPTSHDEQPGRGVFLAQSRLVEVLGRVALWHEPKAAAGLHDGVGALPRATVVSGTEHVVALRDIGRAKDLAVDAPQDHGGAIAGLGLDLVCGPVAVCQL